MAKEAESILKKGGDALREAAAHQGMAYRSYGEALEKFGKGEIDATDLFKTAGDLYFKEVGRVGASLFGAGTNLIGNVLGSASQPLQNAADKPRAAAKK
jgi:hypothetical protein